MVMLNLMTKKKVNQAVPLTQTVAPMHLHTTKQQKTLFGKTNAATVETSKILTKTLLLGPVK